MAKTTKTTYGLTYKQFAALGWLVEAGAVYGKNQSMLRSGATKNGYSHTTFMSLANQGKPFVHLVTDNVGKVVAYSATANGVRAFQTEQEERDNAETAETKVEE